MNTISKYNIKLRLVEEADAGFIVEIRTDPRKSKFISKTNSDVKKQKAWIREYKKREQKQEEFYLIAIDEDNIEFATYRLYNKSKESIEIGSFVSKPLYDKPLNVIKVDIILKEYVFKDLGFNSLKFEVRKDNKTVINYHKKFQPKLVSQDELNYYFVLKKKDFLINKIKFEKLF